MTYLAALTNEQIPTINDTFVPGFRNNRHVRHASEGGGQTLICVYWRGWYQEIPGVRKESSCQPHLTCVRVTPFLNAPTKR